jgi:hypothetical protein
VSAAAPAFGHRGDTGELVTITGSGFAPGAIASWEEGGVTSGKVVVRNTQFVSSTQLVATIDIAADADLALYDIAVTNSDRKKGIGTELFEVTTAVAIAPLGTTSEAQAGSDNGEAVGMIAQRGFYWSDATGLTDLGGVEGYAIDQAGATIGGRGTNGPVIWTRSGSSWTLVNLPKDAATVGGRVDDIASDPTTGIPVVLGGTEEFPSRNYVVQRPRIWKWTGSAWQKIDLAMPAGSTSTTAGWVRAVTVTGMAVGVANGKGVVWEADGRLTVLVDGPLAAVNRAGTMVVGSNGTSAVYFTRAAEGGAWNGPFTLPGGCTNGMGVDDLGRIIARGCRPATGSSRITSAVFAPPYTSAVYLGGLGNTTDGGTAWALSSGGAYIYGSVPTKGNTWVAVRWRNPLY